MFAISSVGSVQRASTDVHSLMEKGPEENYEHGNRAHNYRGNFWGAIFLAYQTDSEEIAMICTFVGARNSLKRALPIK